MWVQTIQGLLAATGDRDPIERSKADIVRKATRIMTGLQERLEGTRQRKLEIEGSIVSSSVPLPAMYNKLIVADHLNGRKSLCWPSESVANGNYEALTRDLPAIQDVEVHFVWMRNNSGVRRLQPCGRSQYLEMAVGPFEDLRSDPEAVAWADKKPGRRSKDCSLHALGKTVVRRRCMMARSTAKVLDIVHHITELSLKFPLALGTPEFPRGQTQRQKTKCTPQLAWSRGRTSPDPRHCGRLRPAVNPTVPQHRPAVNRAVP